MPSGTSDLLKTIVDGSITTCPVEMVGSSAAPTLHNQNRVRINSIPIKGSTGGLKSNRFLIGISMKSALESIDTQLQNRWGGVAECYLQWNMRLFIDR